jgi:hypothetical protein
VEHLNYFLKIKILRINLLYPIPNPEVITRNNEPFKVREDGDDKYSCYSTSDEYYHSVSFVCLAQLAENQNYVIELGPGVYYEFAISPVTEGRIFSLIGAGINASTIIALFRTNDEITTKFNAVFNIGGSSGLIKDMTLIMTSLADRNLFSVSCSLTLENILIKPHIIFTMFGATFTRELFYIFHSSNDADFSFKSLIIEDFINSGRSMFGIGAGGKSFLCDNCIFRNVERTSGGVVFEGNVPNSFTSFCFQNSIFENCKAMGSGGVIKQTDGNSETLSILNCRFLFFVTFIYLFIFFIFIIKFYEMRFDWR